MKLVQMRHQQQDATIMYFCLDFLLVLCLVERNTKSMNLFKALN